MAVSHGKPHVRLCFNGRGIAVKIHSIEILFDLLVFIKVACSRKAQFLRSFLVCTH